MNESKIHMAPFMRRRFLPVGHGAFYCEHFELGDDFPKINVVYDCGTISGETAIENQIKCVFPKKQSKIHAVFLSHMHIDHVSGLERLLKDYQVDRVYFPEIEDTDKTLMDIWFQTTGQSGTFTHAFLMNPQRALRVVVKRDFRFSSPPQLIPVPVTRLSANGSRVLAGGVTLTLADLAGMDPRILPEAFAQWRFVAHNFAQSEVMNDLKTKLEPIVGPVTNANLQAKWKTQSEAIRAIYKTIPHNNLNANSMTLFSGMKRGRLRQRRLRFSQIRFLLKCGKNARKAPGCLYIGDYDAHRGWGALTTAYKGYWNDIGCVQLPHHGSDEDFNEGLLQGNVFYVVSAKEGDAQHPGEEVRHAFSRAKKKYFRATEVENSAVELRVLSPADVVHNYLNAFFGVRICQKNEIGIALSEPIQKALEEVIVTTARPEEKRGVLVECLGMLERLKREVFQTVVSGKTEN